MLLSEQLFDGTETEKEKIYDVFFLRVMYSYWNTLGMREDHWFYIMELRKIASK